MEVETVALPSIVPTGKRRLLPKYTSPPFEYDALQDPALKDWFSRKGIKKGRHIQDAWFLPPPTCPACGHKVAQPLPQPCQSCSRTYHKTCLPVRQLTSYQRIILILTSIPQALEPLADYLRTTHGMKVDVVDPGKQHVGVETLPKYSAVLLALYPGPIPPGTLRKALTGYLEETRGGVVVALHPHTHAVLPGRVDPFIAGGVRSEPFLTVEHSSDVEMPFLEDSDRSFLQDGAGFEVGAQPHPLTDGVEEVGGAEGVRYTVGLSKGRVVLRWANSVPLVSVLEKMFEGRVVSVNVMPMAKLRKKGEWIEFWDPASASTHHLISNALRFVSDPTYQDPHDTFNCPSCRAEQHRARLIDGIEDPGSKSHVGRVPPISNQNRIKSRTPASRKSHSRPTQNEIRLPPAPSRPSKTPKTNIHSSFPPSKTASRHAPPPSSQKGPKLPKGTGSDDGSMLPPIDGGSSTTSLRRRRPEGAGKGSRQPVFSGADAAKADGDGPEATSPPPPTSLPSQSTSSRHASHEQISMPAINATESRHSLTSSRNAIEVVEVM
ncbi:hypothetical protein DFS34DRAFT_376250 [Phlyctochytrium arcticum]|nr:hypothetical protein DFS34DRAFT_376250 [Phlyctochytrium arcticum]